jgi:hypothetical protein
MSAVLGDLVDRLLGRDGTRWAGSVEDLLYEGETIRREVPVGEDSVVVTSHRLLAFTPTGEGENYRQVDLPNVADVSAGHDGERTLLVQAGRAFLYGAVLLAVGVFVDFGAFVPTDVFANASAAGRIGLGGVIGLVQRFLNLVASLDDIARLVGALVVLFSVFVLAVYLLTRDRAVVVHVAGDAEDVVVPVDDGATVDAAVADLERALFDPAAETATDSTGVETDPADVGADANEADRSGDGTDRDRTGTDRNETGTGRAVNDHGGDPESGSGDLFG